MTTAQKDYTTARKYKVPSNYHGNFIDAYNGYISSDDVPHFNGISSFKAGYFGKGTEALSAGNHGGYTNETDYHYNMSYYGNMTSATDSIGYRNITLLNPPQIVLLNVAQVKDVATQSFFYELTSENGQKFGECRLGPELTLSAFKAQYGEQYVVTSFAVYDNSNNGSVSASNPRTVTAGAEYFLRLSALDSQYKDNGQNKVIHSGYVTDFLFPVFRTFYQSVSGGFSHQLYNSTVYLSKSQTNVKCFMGGGNTGKTGLISENAGAGYQGLTCFATLSDLVRSLNYIGVPFTFSATQATSNNTSDFNYYIEPSQPTDVTGGGEGAGNNGNDTTSQNDPALSPISAFNKHYAVSQSGLNSLSDYLWSANFMDNIKLLFNDPAEGVIDCRMYPFSIPAHDISHIGATEPIQIGNVVTDVNAYPILGGYNCRFNLGALKIDEYYGTAMDYEPYTSLQIFLPYIGYKDISTNDCMNKTISIQYIVDITTGSCTAEIWIDSKYMVYAFDGKIGVTIPLSSTNSSQYATTNALSVISGGMGVAMGAITANPLIMAGSVISTAKSVASNQMHIQKGGANSPMCSMYMPQNAFLIVSRPIQSLASSFYTTKGAPCNVTKALSALTGYTEIDTPILTGITATEEEKAQIKNLLETGVIFA